jgi:hypothetical protein
MKWRRERNKLPTPAESKPVKSAGEAHKDTLKSNAMWGHHFKSLKGHKAYTRLTEQITHNEQRAINDMLICKPEDLLGKREEVKAYRYVLNFVDKQIELGQKAQDQLDKLETKGAEKT